MEPAVNADQPTVLLGDLTALTGAAVATVDALYDEARAAVREAVDAGGQLSGALIEREQHMVHGLAWLATYAETLRSLSAYAHRLEAEDRLGEMEELLVQIAFGEYLAHIAGGIPMNQQEFARLSDFGIRHHHAARLHEGQTGRLMGEGSSPAARARLVELMIAAEGQPTFGDCGLDDTADHMRAEMRRFIEAKVVPHAHQWHLDNAYVPMEIVDELAALGVFALTLPEEYGGLGLGKEVDVRGLRGAVARLDRRRLARHPRRDRFGTHPRRRH